MFLIVGYLLEIFFFPTSTMGFVKYTVSLSLLIWKVI